VKRRGPAPIPPSQSRDLDALVRKREHRDKDRHAELLADALVALDWEETEEELAADPAKKDLLIECRKQMWLAGLGEWPEKSFTGVPDNQIAS
jgi:hypothetical protein